MFFVQALGGSLPQGCVPVWGVCHRAGHTFSDPPGGHFWESPGEKEKTQNAMTPNEPYHAFVAGADAPPLAVSCL